MRNKICALVLVITGIFSAGVANAMAAEVKVDDDGAQCANADFTSIQAAVNAAEPGDKVTVCPGTYAEQVTIGAGKNNLKLVSQKPLQATIKAPAVMAEPGDIVRITDGARTSSSRTSRSPARAGCALLHGADRTGVRVDGNAFGDDREEPHHRDPRGDPALRGCQNGVGIQVGRPPMAGRHARRSARTRSTCTRRTASTCTRVSSFAKIENNVVKDAGATEITAPNGIQVSRRRDRQVATTGAAATSTTCAGLERHRDPALRQAPATEVRTTTSSATTTGSRCTTRPA